MEEGAVQTVLLGDRGPGACSSWECAWRSGLQVTWAAPYPYPALGSEHRVAHAVEDVMSHVGPVLIALESLRFDGALIARTVGSVVLGLGAGREQNPLFQTAHLGFWGPEAQVELGLL